MAVYKKYDPRVDSLVVETKTLWDAETAQLSDDDKRYLAEAIHKNPQLAGKIEYEREHTGFLRVVTVTADDVARLYEQTQSE